MFTSVHSRKVVHAMYRVYFMQVFLDISSVCMTVAELYFLLFQVSQ